MQRLWQNEAGPNPGGTSSRPNAGIPGPEGPRPTTPKEAATGSAPSEGPKPAASQLRIPPSPTLCGGIATAAVNPMHAPYEVQCLAAIPRRPATTASNPLPPIRYRPPRAPLTLPTMWRAQRLPTRRRLHTTRPRFPEQPPSQSTRLLPEAQSQPVYQVQPFLLQAGGYWGGPFFARLILRGLAGSKSAPLSGGLG